ncbi:MAG: 30S ribosomal protein S11 [Patescibacteria group bacterium]
MGKKKIVTKVDTEVSATPGAAAPARRGAKRQVLNGIANISISYNNTIISIADMKGNVLSWCSSGLLGFKGTKKSTPYAANLVAKDCLEKSKKYGVANLKIVVRGVGPARESAIRGIASSGLHILSLLDRTPVAHNGVRARKPRRI